MGHGGGGPDDKGICMRGGGGGFPDDKGILLLGGSILGVTIFGNPLLRMSNVQHEACSQLMTKAMRSNAHLRCFRPLRPQAPN